MGALVGALLIVPLLGVVLPFCIYLALLTVVAPFGARRPPRHAGPLRRFALLVPAHNEELVVGRLLGSLAELAYPSELFDTWVVADNCTDSTAAVAGGGGAVVVERHDLERRGKGFALQWLLDEIGRSGRRYDAYIVLDADSVVSANLLTAMNDRLNAGARVVQGYYTVLPLRGSPAESLRQAALALVHYLRPTAKTALGLSCGLKGNGMAFERSVLERFGWPCAGLTEDVELHLRLVAAGLRVAFAPEAVVWGEMPATLGRADSQNLRWEAGRLATLRRQALPLLRQGLRTRSPAAVDAALEQFMPPLSVPVAVAGGCLLAGLLLGQQWVVLTAALLLGVIGVYVLAGLLLARSPLRVYRALLHAPVYLLWKAALYGRALTGRHDGRWIRTERLDAR